MTTFSPSARASAQVQQAMAALFALPNPERMPIQRDFQLQAHNTFGLAARAEAFADIRSEAELLALLARPERPLRIIGGGSNLLLTQDLGGLLLANRIMGIEVLEEDEGSVLLRVGGGEAWPRFVAHCIAQGWGGVENLSLIPGTVGAAPIQNIGAYGAELADVFDRLEAIELATGRLLVFDKAACAFGYRDSVFKRAWRGRLCITRVCLRLHKAPHALRLGYGAVADTLAAWGIEQPGIADVGRAVSHIRRSKLPDPAVLGNSGSFFKNPDISAGDWAKLQAAHPEAPHYPMPDGRVKVPAGWLIEQCGWKGRRVGQAGCHAQQALVLVNYGGATGEDIWAFAQMVMASVAERFGIALEPEVNVW